MLASLWYQTSAMEADFSTSFVLAFFREDMLWFLSVLTFILVTEVESHYNTFSLAVTVDLKYPIHSNRDSASKLEHEQHVLMQKKCVFVYVCICVFLYISIYV